MNVPVLLKPENLFAESRVILPDEQRAPKGEGQRLRSEAETKGMMVAGNDG